MEPNRHINGAPIVTMHAETRVSATKLGFGKLPGEAHNY
jgi:hypothetical protein